MNKNNSVAYCKVLQYPGNKQTKVLVNRRNLGGKKKRFYPLDFYI